MTTQSALAASPSSADGHAPEVPPRTGGSPPDTLLRSGVESVVRAWVGPVGAFLRAHPTAADVALVALLVVPSGVRFLPGTLSYSLDVPAQILLLLPLIWRRRAPVTVFVVLNLAPPALSLLGMEPHADLALLVSFYTIAAHQSLLRAVACLLALFVAATVVLWQVAPPGTFWTATVLCTGLFVATGFIGTNVRTRRAYLAALEDRAARLERERDQQAQIAVAQERARIAREMHDIVAHNLSVMIALADGAVFANRADPVHGEAVMHQVSETGRQALDDMRRVLGVLRSGGTDAALMPQPSVDDLDELLAKVTEAGVRTELTVTGIRFPLQPAIQLAIYRLVQEALTNTLKHSCATAVQVRLHFAAGRTVEVEVTDDGLPRRRPAAQPGGHGLVGMRERVALFAGTLHAGPAGQGGWRVRALLHAEGSQTAP